MFINRIVPITTATQDKSRRTTTATDPDHRQLSNQEIAYKTSESLPNPAGHFAACTIERIRVNLYLAFVYVPCNFLSSYRTLYSLKDYTLNENPIFSQTTSTYDTVVVINMHLEKLSLILTYLLVYY